MQMQWKMGRNRQAEGAARGRGVQLGSRAAPPGPSELAAPVPDVRVGARGQQPRHRVGVAFRGGHE